MSKKKSRIRTHQKSPVSQEPPLSQRIDSEGTRSMAPPPFQLMTGSTPSSQEGGANPAEEGNSGPISQTENFVSSQWEGVKSWVAGKWDEGQEQKDIQRNQWREQGMLGQANAWIDEQKDGFVEGLAGGLTETGEGLVEMAWDIGKMTNPATRLLDEENLSATTDKYGDMLAGLGTMGKNLLLDHDLVEYFAPEIHEEASKQNQAMLDGMLEPYEDAWENGEYGKILGRLTPDIIDLVAGSHGALKANRVLGIAEDAGSVTNKLDNLPNVKSTKNPPPRGQPASSDVVGKQSSKENLEGKVDDIPTPSGGVYGLEDLDGNIIRTGRSKDLERRKREHDKEFEEYNFVEMFRTDQYAEQRGLEHFIHQKYNTTAGRENGGLNKIRAIGEKNKNKDGYIEAAESFLERYRNEK